MKTTVFTISCINFENIKQSENNMIFLIICENGKWKSVFSNQLGNYLMIEIPVVKMSICYALLMQACKQGFYAFWLCSCS